MANINAERCTMINIAARAAGLFEFGKTNQINYVKWCFPPDWEVKIFDIPDREQDILCFLDLTDVMIDFGKLIKDADERGEYTTHLICKLYLNPTFMSQLSDDVLTYIKTHPIDDFPTIVNLSKIVLKYYRNTDMFTCKIYHLFGGISRKYRIHHEPGYCPVFNKYWQSNPFGKDLDKLVIDPISALHEGSIEDIKRVCRERYDRHQCSASSFIKRPFTIPLNDLKDIVTNDNLWIHLISCGLLTTEDIFKLFSVVDRSIYQHIINAIHHACKNGVYDDIIIEIDFPKITDNTRSTYVPFVINTNKHIIVPGIRPEWVLHLHCKWTPENIAILDKLCPFREIHVVHPSFRIANNGKPYAFFNHITSKCHVPNDKLIPIVSDDMTYEEFIEKPCGEFKALFDSGDLVDSTKKFIKRLHYDYSMKKIISSKKTVMLCSFRGILLQDLATIIMTYMTL